MLIFPFYGKFAIEMGSPTGRYPYISDGGYKRVKDAKSYFCDPDEMEKTIKELRALWDKTSNIVINSAEYLFGAAAKNWVRNLSANLPAAGSVALLLILTGGVSLSAYSLNILLQKETSDALVLHVYLRDDASSFEVDGLESTLKKEKGITSVTYTSKNQALAKASSHPGLPEIAGATDSNPFPASLDVKVVNIDRLASLDKEMRKVSIVDPDIPTSYDQKGYQKLSQFLTGVTLGAFVFLLVLGMVALAVTTNAVRSAVAARKTEIEIMMLVGAPRWMVRGPFILEGALTGMVAGGGAAGVLLLAGHSILTTSSGFFANPAPGITWALFENLAVFIILLGGVLGAGSSLWGVGKSLKT